jgi:hypothetical protein
MGKILDASLTFDVHAGRLKSGKLSWYKLDVADWKLSWKIRCEVSVTQIETGYGYQLVENAFPHSGKRATARR